MKHLISFNLIIAISLISSLLILFKLDKSEYGYELLWIHPFIFILIFIFFLAPIIKKGHYKITIYSFTILAFIRMVAIPLSSFLSGNFNGVEYFLLNSTSANLSIIMVSYEMIVGSLSLFILTKLRFFVKHNNFNLTKLTLKGSKLFYLFFIGFSIIIYIIYGKGMLNFFVISANIESRVGDLEGTFSVLIRFIITTGILFLYLLLINKFKNLYEYTRHKFYFYMALIISIINVGIIIGERRSVIVYTGFITIIILLTYFKKYKNEILIYLTTSISLILIFMSIYKHFYAFSYGSYTSALLENDLDLAYYSSMLQAYFFGTQNVAISLQLANVIDLSLLNMAYDYLRSTFGFNVLLKETMTLTSQYFNTYIYGFESRSGHVLSAIGYGYIYFGPLLAPIIILINITLSLLIERYFNKTFSLEMKYILGYILFRFSTNLFVATPPLISLSTNLLFTAGLVYFVGLLMNPQRNRIRNELT